MITFVFSIITIIAVVGTMTYSGTVSPWSQMLIVGIVLFLDIYAYLFTRSYRIIGENKKVSPLYCAGKAVLLIVISLGMVVISLGVLGLFGIASLEGIFWTAVIGSAIILPAGAAAFITGLIFGAIHRGSPRSSLIP